MEKVVPIAFQQESGQVIYSFSESSMTGKDDVSILICKSNICRTLKQIICNLFQVQHYMECKKKKILFSSYRKPLFPREEASVPTKVARMYSNVDFSHYPGAIKQCARKWLTLKLCFVSSEDWRICLTKHGQVRKYPLGDEQRRCFRVSTAFITHHD